MTFTEHLEAKNELLSQLYGEPDEEIRKAIKEAIFELDDEYYRMPVEVPF